MIVSTGGGGGTDWTALRVDQMWAMLASQDTSAHTRLADGWRRSQDLVREHIARVRAYRDGLASAWPPSRSPAAAAYFARLDGLLANLTETYDAAVANHRAVAGAAGALQSARREMADIHREHAANEVLLAAHAEQKRLHQLAPGKARGAPPRGPVADGRQTVLETRARMVMQALSTELAQAQTALVVPARYDMPPGLPAHRRPLPGAPPSLPAPRATSASPARLPDPPGPPDPGPARRGSAVAGNRTAVPGAGAAQHAVGAPGRGTGTARPGTPRPAPGTTSRDQDRPGPASVPAGGRQSRPDAGRRDPVIGRSAGFPASGESAGRVAPAGHVIGAPPSTDASREAGATAARHVNPVGGLVGRPSPAREEPVGARRRFSLADQWEIATGVDPVIEPPGRRPVDPGPLVPPPHDRRPIDPGPVLGRPSRAQAR